LHACFQRGDLVAEILDLDCNLWSSSYAEEGALLLQFVQAAALCDN
jgi:hypothetical protein